MTSQATGARPENKNQSGRPRSNSLLTASTMANMNKKQSKKNQAGDVMGTIRCTAAPASSNGNSPAIMVKRPIRPSGER